MLAYLVWNVEYKSGMIVRLVDYHTVQLAQDQQSPSENRSCHGMICYYCYVISEGPINLQISKTESGLGILSIDVFCRFAIIFIKLTISPEWL